MLQPQHPPTSSTSPTMPSGIRQPPSTLDALAPTSPFLRAAPPPSGRALVSAPHSTSSDLSSLDGSDDDRSSAGGEEEEDDEDDDTRTESGRGMEGAAPGEIAQKASSSSGSLSSSRQVNGNGSTPRANGSSSSHHPGSKSALTRPPPAPRSLSSALSPAGSSPHSSPTSATDPLPSNHGSPRSPSPTNEGDDGPQGDDGASIDEGEGPSSTTSSPPVVSRRLPFPTKPRTSNPSLVSNPPVSNGAAPLSSSTSSQLAGQGRARELSGGSSRSPLKQDELHALGIWKGEEEGDSDLTPDEDGDDEDGPTSRSNNRPTALPPSSSGPLSSIKRESSPNHLPSSSSSSRQAPLVDTPKLDSHSHHPSHPPAPFPAPTRHALPPKPGSTVASSSTTAFLPHRPSSTDKERRSQSREWRSRSGTPKAPRADRERAEGSSRSGNYPNEASSSRPFQSSNSYALSHHTSSNQHSTKPSSSRNSNGHQSDSGSDLSDSPSSSSSLHRRRTDFSRRPTPPHLAGKSESSSRRPDSPLSLPDKAKEGLLASASAQHQGNSTVTSPTSEGGGRRSRSPRRNLDALLTDDGLTSSAATLQASSAPARPSDLRASPSSIEQLADQQPPSRSADDEDDEDNAERDDAMTPALDTLPAVDGAGFMGVSIEVVGQHPDIELGGENRKGGETRPGDDDDEEDEAERDEKDRQQQLDDKNRRDESAEREEKEEGEEVEEEEEDEEMAEGKMEGIEVPSIEIAPPAEDEPLAGRDKDQAESQSELAEREEAEAKREASEPPLVPEIVVEEEEEEKTSVSFATQQRMDAMEALAKIEIAFARLRDRIHIERMLECQKEEEALLNGSHPVLIALQSRLAALRQRELGIAARRLAEVEREHENVRKADISGVWEWWRNGREELQRDMMADVMRKRRRVDREKRTVEGGRPKRPLPIPPLPSAAIHPSKRRRMGPPDLEALLPGSYIHQPDERRRLREEREVWGPRPGLMGLPERGVEGDLELLGIGRQQAFRPFDQPPNMGHHHSQHYQPGPPPHHAPNQLNHPPPPPHYRQLNPHYRPPPPPGYVDPNQHYPHPYGPPSHPQQQGGPSPPHHLHQQQYRPNPNGPPPSHPQNPNPNYRQQPLPGRQPNQQSQLGSHQSFESAFGGGGGQGSESAAKRRRTESPAIVGAGASSEEAKDKKPAGALHGRPSARPPPPPGAQTTNGNVRPPPTSFGPPGQQQPRPPQSSASYPPPSLANARSSLPPSKPTSNASSPSINAPPKPPPSAVLANDLPPAPSVPLSPPLAAVAKPPSFSSSASIHTNPGSAFAFPPPAFPTSLNSKPLSSSAGASGPSL